MKMILMVFAIIVLATPAHADGIRVSPGEARPGQRIHITVPDCGVGPTRHTATSDAFTHRATLHGKADTGEADPRIKKGAAPGTYSIKATCGASTVLGQVVVAGHRPAAGAPPTAPRGGHESNGPYWAFAAALVLLAGGGALVAVRRRR
jgi:hypothetical protein